MFGGIVGAALGWAGKKPKVPAAPNVDVSAETAKSYADISKNLPQLEEIAAQINQFNTQQLLDSWRKILPGIGKVRRQAVKNTEALVSGELPSDVLRNLRNAGAAAARSSGTAGGTFGFNYTPTFIGKTTLDLQQQGLGNLLNLSNTFRAPTYDFTSLFVTPTQRMAAEQWNEMQRFQQQTAVNQIKAMPSPLQNELMASLHNFDKLTWSLASTAAGAGITSAMGSSGGGGGGAGSAEAPSWQEQYRNYYGNSGQAPNFNPMGGNFYGM